MRIAIVTRPKDPISLRVYQQNIISELKKVGVTFINIPQNGKIPTGCDLVWDPGLGMRRVPEVLTGSKLPVVVTVHGVRVFYFPEKDLNYREKRVKQMLTNDWKSFKNQASAIITVSNYGAEEVCSAFDISSNKVYPIYHGVNQQIFHPQGEKRKHSNQYFLHVAQYQPLKNSVRLFAAYSKLLPTERPNLIAIVPGFSDDLSKWKIPGLYIINKEVSPLELAKWYRGAIGFLFPSIRETFGLPILEAMACGCPVITSNKTGCAEISGSVAIQVDPLSISDIHLAMKTLAEDKNLRDKLSLEGINHAKGFHWKRSGDEHFKLFAKIIKDSKN